jgi:hypothetical protein
MQGKWPDQPLDQAFGLPEVLVAVSSSRLSCKRAAKTHNVDAGLDSSGESRLNSLNHQEITIETGTEYSKGWGQWFQVFRIKHLGQTIIDSTGTRAEERVERGWA